MLLPLLLLACKPIAVGTPESSVARGSRPANDSGPEHVGCADTGEVEDSPEPEGWPKACDAISDPEIAAGRKVSGTVH